MTAKRFQDCLENYLFSSKISIPCSVQHALCTLDLSQNECNFFLASSSYYYCQILICFSGLTFTIYVNYNRALFAVFSERIYFKSSRRCWADFYFIFQSVWCSLPDLSAHWCEYFAGVNHFILSLIQFHNCYLFAAGSIQGLHNMHGSFNIPNMPSTLTSRNSTINSMPTGAVQQPTSSLSSGRFTSNNLPSALSQVHVNAFV